MEKRPRKKAARASARKRSPAKALPRAAKRPLNDDVQAALSWLERKSTPRDRENLARFGISAGKAFGVSMANIQLLAKRLGRSHELAAALWDTGWYEARMLTAFVDEPARVTPAQMDRWCRDFDNWGICDTLCFCLFDRTPHAWAKVAQWSDDRREFVKRAAFALLASLAGHDKSAGDERFVEGLRLIERAAVDERNFVKKGVSWALRRIGRRNAALHAAAVKTARRLSASPEAAARWVGNGALKDRLTTRRDPEIAMTLTPDRLDATFAALADPTRRAILARLASGEASVTELAAPFAMSQPAISKHLKVLERAGLISRGRDAQKRPRRLEPKPLAEATEWLERYRQTLEGSFQRLDALLEELQPGDVGRRRKRRRRR